MENDGTNITESVGSVYGKIGIQGQEIGPESVKVVVDETDLVAGVDKYGLFYFPSINPGIYTIRARLDNYADDIIENVEISEDSLTFIPSFLLRKATDDIRSTWEGIKIKRVSLEDLGCIEGQVNSSGIPITDAIVHLPGTFWSVKTDGAGRYEVKVLSGQYAVRSFKPSDQSNQYGFGPTEYYNVIANTEKSSLVNFELRSGVYREIKPAIEWTSDFKEMGC